MNEKDIAEQAYKNGYRQAVKDTAIEVLQMIRDIGGCGATDEWGKGWDRAIDTACDEISYRYGVEVEL